MTGKNFPPPDELDCRGHIADQLLSAVGPGGLTPAVFSTVVIPTEVFAELSHPGAPKLVRDWVAALPAWISVKQVGKPLLLSADPGEVAALSLAREISCDQVLLDDAQGRQLARELGLKPIGTLRVLELGAEASLIDLEATLSALQKLNFRIHPRVIALLRKNG